MKIISCTGYYGTGSSAITDYMAEFDNCFNLTDYEFRFIQDPNGVSDLEYNLVENHHRHNSGHALKRYKILVDFLAGNKYVAKYEKFFNYQWKRISYEYIDKLTEFKYSGYWHQDVIDKGILIYSIYRIVNKILRITIWRNQERALNELPNEITYCSMPGEDKFLELTKEYTNKLFTCANIEKKKYIMVDQLVPASNLNRYLRYFNDIRVIVVDRDPRDIYLLEKYVWKGRVIPTDSVQNFCEWYDYTRRHRKYEKYDETRVLLLNFEQLVYDYDNTTKRINDFLGISEENHVFKNKKFSPKESSKNTKLWTRIKNVEDEVNYIEKTLISYLYNY